MIQYIQKAVSLLKCQLNRKPSRFKDVYSIDISWPDILYEIIFFVQVQNGAAQGTLL